MTKPNTYLGDVNWYIHPFLGHTLLKHCRDTLIPQDRTWLTPNHRNYDDDIMVDEEDAEKIILIVSLGGSESLARLTTSIPPHLYFEADGDESSWSEYLKLEASVIADFKEYVLAISDEQVTQWEKGRVIKGDDSPEDQQIMDNLVVDIAERYSHLTEAFETARAGVTPKDTEEVPF